MSERKRFWLFAYDYYYPTGGSGEVRGKFDTIEEAQAARDECVYDEKEILDLDTGEWL